MDSARWQWIQDLFHQAADLSPGGRREFLNEACAGDAEAMSEVLSLLEEESRGGSILDSDFARAAGVLLGERDFSRRTVGPYRILRMVGEGGMGVVYLGERDDLDHQAAIKLLPDAWMSPARRGRFAVEQRTLSRLNHPAIAHLYDAGTLDDGTPWFSMEYVEGLPITEFCEAHKLPLIDRLALFRQVCEAVQHAHQHAVLHRDLKPANILVKADRTVRLLDFGIAKPLDRPGANLTQLGMGAATPAYAAPEQIRGEPTAIPADVYSLGVVLTELLTGKLPPAALPDRDLEVLCLTATHSEPTRRYPSVEALLRDIVHYVRKEPLEARPEGFGYRAGKFVRRHSGALTAAGLAAVVLAGTVVFFTLRLRTARDEALAEAHRAQHARAFLTHLFEGGDAQAGPAENLRVLTLVDRGAREVQTLADPSAQGDLYHTLGTVYQSLGKYAPASEMLESSLSVRNRAASPAAIGESLTALAMLRQDQGKLEEAEKLARQSIEHGRKTLPAGHPERRAALSALGRVQFDRGQLEDSVRTLEQVIAMIPRTGSAAQERATALERLANAKFYLGQYDETEALSRQLLSLSRQVYGAKHPQVASPLINLGAVAHQRARYQEAEALYGEALEINRAYYGEEHPETAAARNGVAQALAAQKRYAEAEPMLLHVLAVRERTYGKVHPNVASTLSNLGGIAYQRDRLDEASAYFLRMRDIYRQVNGENHNFVGLASANLATVLIDKRDYAGAERMLRQVLSIYAKSLPADHLDVGITRVKLGRVLLRQGRHQEAHKESTAGLEIVKKHATESSPWIVSARKDLAAVQSALGTAAPAQ